jgi:glutamine amidotransferase-like uncharacterized protein
MSMSMFLAATASGCASSPDELHAARAEGVDTRDQSGLVGTYFDNLDFANQVLERVDATVDFNWGSGAPKSSIGADTFSVRWNGFVRAQFSESYTFYTVSDDGVRLWVNGQLIVNNWTDHAPVQNKGIIALEAGKTYPIKMEYYERGGGAVARLLWSSASVTKQVIPTERLSTQPIGQRCAQANENSTATLSCSSGETISSINFASYGVPAGSCKSGFAVGTCHAASSKTKVQASCLNQPTCTVPANNNVFGDPCSGTYKNLAVTYTCSASPPPTTDSGNPDPVVDPDPVELPHTALIFDRTPHACNGCESAMKRMLQKCNNDWEIDYVGSSTITADRLKKYSLYVQPGGYSPGSGKKAFKDGEIGVIKNWISEGGNYYGVCWGGFAIGRWVFGFIDDPYNSEVESRGSGIDGYDAVMVPVVWGSDRHWLYFEDGPTWDLDPSTLSETTVYATYERNGDLAVIAFPYGAGMVGASGVHTEADGSWYGDLRDPDGYDKDYRLGCEVIKDLMKR